MINVRALASLSLAALLAALLGPSCTSGPDADRAAATTNSAGSAASSSVAGQGPGGANGGIGGVGGGGGLAVGGAGGGQGPCSEEHPTWTVGLKQCSPECFDGYTLFSPSNYETTYLIDIRGRLVHSWQSGYRPALSGYLLDDGRLLRPGALANPEFPMGGRGGVIELLDWDGSVLWSYTYSDSQRTQHHDIEPLPNGNVLLVAWERHTQAEMVDAGRDPALVPANGMWIDTIVEVAPTAPNAGDVVWRWDALDHLVQDRDPSKDNYVSDVADHPNRLDIGFPPTLRIDWLHLNAVDYHAGLDQIVVSSRAQGELYVIDHATATANYDDAPAAIAAAAGPEGDLLYRWGNPQVYSRGAAVDQQLFAPHDARWIEPTLPGAGDLLIFNNGEDRPAGQYSSVEQLVPPIDADGSYQLQPLQAYGPPAPLWHYQAANPLDLYTPTGSGAQRLANGNTLLCVSNMGMIVEVTAAGETVWEYLVPVDYDGPMVQGSESATRRAYRAHRYDADYPGLQGRSLVPGGYIEL
mgnify:CR=1 FL=1